MTDIGFAAGYSSMAFSGFGSVFQVLDLRSFFGFWTSRFFWIWNFLVFLDLDLLAFQQFGFGLVGFFKGLDLVGLSVWILLAFQDLDRWFSDKLDSIGFRRDIGRIDIRYQSTSGTNIVRLRPLHKRKSTLYGYENYYRQFPEALFTVM